jgi:hypothetical protein
LFDLVQNRSVRKRDVALSWAKVWSRHRLTRVFVGCGLILGGLTIVGIAYVHVRAAPEPCQAVPATHLTMDQLKAVKKKLANYRANPKEGIRLDSKEASFILADNLKYPVEMSFDGKQLAAHLLVRSETERRCYDVHFQGQVEVDAGLAKVVPTELMVGTLNLSWFAGGQTFLIDHMVFGEGAAADMLQQTQRLRVEDGTIHVDLEDPKRIR